MKKEVKKFPLTDFVSLRKEPKKIPLKPSDHKQTLETEYSLNHENFETNDKEGLHKLES
jgi:hypothetical protein